MDISERDRRIRLKIGVVPGILFLTASLYFFVEGAFQIRDGVRSKLWPVVAGIVVSSEVGVSSARSSGSANHSYSYSPEIRYSYVVDDLDYKSERLQFIHDGVGRAWAEQKVLTYPVQANVEVFYDPDNPQIAVLEPGGKLVWYLFACAASLVFALVFAVFAWLLFKDARKMMEMNSN